MVERIEKLLKNSQLDNRVRKGLEELLENSDLDDNIRKTLQQLRDRAMTNERRFKKLLARSDKEDSKIRKLHQELDSYKNCLETKVEEKDKILSQQSKFEAMGEMIDAVAHQWKQPINAIYSGADMLDFAIVRGKVDTNYLMKYREKTLNQINHMIDTLDEFRTFFKPNKYENEFSIKEIVDKVLVLIEDELISYKIEVVVDCKEDFKLMGRENEFKHLIINLINNAKEAFIKNNIKKRVIKINIFRNDFCKTIEIIDNAGGVPKKIINDIFKVDVTTKDGGGIGLYMSLQIAEKHNGELKVENIEDGAKFIFCKRIEE